MTSANQNPGEEAWGFATPSGDRCSLLLNDLWPDIRVRCDVFFDSEVSVPTSGLVPQTPLLQADGASFVALSGTDYAVTGDWSVLGHDETLNLEDVSCTVTEQHIRCENDVGHWMELARDGYAFSDNG